MQGFFRRAFAVADGLEPRGQHQAVEFLDRQRQEQVDAPVEHAIGVLERQRDLGLAALRRSGIGNAPMSGDRLARP
jgi:hypothetical protein